MNQYGITNKYKASFINGRAIRKEREAFNESMRLKQTQLQEFGAHPVRCDNYIRRT